MNESPINEPEKRQPIASQGAAEAAPHDLADLHGALDEARSAEESHDQATLSDALNNLAIPSATAIESLLAIGPKASPRER